VLGGELPEGGPEQIALWVAAEVERVERLESGLALGVGPVAAAGDIVGLTEPGPAEPPALIAEYFVHGSGNNAFLFLIGHRVREEIAVYQVPGREEIEAAVDRWDPAVGGEPPEPVRAVLEALLAPVHDTADPGDVVCLVPHGPLHRLALHAVPIGGKRLVESFAVCYVPSASVLVQARARRPERRARRGALVVGDPLGDLGNARAEARAVARLFGVTARLGRDATKEAVLDLDGDGPAVVHLACHGTWEEEAPALSGLWLASAEGWTVLTAEEVDGLRLNAALVTLSACDSGLNTHRPGDELMGFARAFLHAGAEAVLVALWSVDDLASWQLMERFYRLLLGDESPVRRPAAALALAQTELMRATAGQLVERVSDRIEWADDADDRRRLRMEVARLRVKAGDVAGALGDYEALLADGVAVERNLRLLRLKQEAGDLQPDYNLRPFADPRYWAGFALIGDWAAGTGVRR
jgi:CHAT domain-containing protein